MLRIICAGLLLSPLLPLAWAQQGRQANQPGTVTGHIFCADTQRPARLAPVRLLRVPVVSDPATDNKPAPGNALAGDLGPIVETSLDGSFILPGVKPGSYYLIVEKEGYLDPVAAFSGKELTSSDPHTRQRIERTLHEFEVAPGETVNQEVSLERGASISGTATFDDNTPAAGLAVTLLAKDMQGKWSDRAGQRYREDFGFVRTDDYGRYRVTGLAAGDYLIKIDLALNRHTTSAFPSPENPGKQVTMYSTEAVFSLPLFTGNVWRRKLALPVSVASGENKSGVDLQFPLAKLHPVGGQVLAKDGYAINHGLVSVVYADNRDKVIDTKIQFAEADFRMDFVPEGEYLLTVTGAQDVAHVQIPNPKGFNPPTHVESKTLRTYGDSEQPLVVKGDTLGIIAAVPDHGQSGGTN